MGRLSAAMKTELQKPNPDAHYILDLALPGGTKRYGEATVASAVGGQYRGRLLELPRYAFSASDMSLQGVELRPVLDDHDYELAKIVTGSSGNAVLYAAATLRLASPNVAEASWLTEFSGVIDAWAFPALHRIQFRLRPNDLALDRYFPKTAVERGIWPNADAAAVGQYVPLLYGKFLSSSGGGAVPCLYVDTIGFRYLVCAGRAKQVIDVFVDGTKQSAALYTVTYPIVNGRVYTLVDFTSTQGTAAISVDVEGYESVGDGTGAVITEPAAQLKHLLVNWVFGDYKTGAWLSDSTAPINTTYFSETSAFLSARGYKGSRYYGGQQQGMDVVNEWAQSMQSLVFWDGSGKLAVRIVDHAALDIYAGTWFRGDKHDLGIGIDYPTAGLIDRVSVQYLRNEVDNRHTLTLEVRDPALTKVAPDSLELAWAYGSET